MILRVFQLPHWIVQRHAVRGLRTNWVEVGNIQVKVNEPKHPWLVPLHYFPEHPSPWFLSHMHWLLQKIHLKQDVFLLGPPGPWKRRVASAVAELLCREVEYLPITRDTSEMDLKQRKEISHNSTVFHNQAVVRAATEGRILILEGMEKAERNVLPVLNNLLENREMQLEDGRFLMHPKRFQELAEIYGEKEMEELGVVAVHEDFQVIALGLPVPRFPGHPLDPPLRSRFQCRAVTPPPYKDLLEMAVGISPNASSVTSRQIVSWASTMASSEWSGLGIPDFPLHSLSNAFHILDRVPMKEEEIPGLLHRLYPWKLFAEEGSKAVEKSLKKFIVPPKKPEKKATAGKILVEVTRMEEPDGDLGFAKVTSGNDAFSLPVPVGRGELGKEADKGIVETEAVKDLLVEMLESHSIGHDLLLVGPRASGKSTIAYRFAQLLGYHVEPVLLYQDMTSRDLVQGRMTDEKGNTTWRFSSLVEAALNGHVAVLDGIHRLHRSTLNVLHRLVHDRELDLYDGRRLMGKDRYEDLQASLGLTHEEMESRGILPIHPAFRILALADSPQDAEVKWLDAEVLSIFLTHSMPDWSAKSLSTLVSSLYGEVPEKWFKLLELREMLRQGKEDSNTKSLGGALSLRQMLRAAKIFSAFPHSSAEDFVKRTCLYKFLPILGREMLDDSLKKANLCDHVDASGKEMNWSIDDGTLTIGETRIPMMETEGRMQVKVPSTLFYDIQQQLEVLEEMIKDFDRGEHLLLMGTQGVGKNRLVDRMLSLLQYPREYIQLHRDTTVSSLTVKPCISEGRVSYEDSPLVTAVRLGHALVVDEADKAPTHVTCILKNLIEQREMVLSDGRRIVPPGHRADDPNCIPIHPNFRMIILANPPGYPFLGNDFYSTLGDVFACHVIENPDRRSELALLRAYGGENVGDHVLEPLVSSLQDLRERSQKGALAYPYSTREAVAVVKHLKMFPEDGLSGALRNVLDFDQWNEDSLAQVKEVLMTHGIPFGASPQQISLGTVVELPRAKERGVWIIRGDSEESTMPIHLPVSVKHMSFEGVTKMSLYEGKLDLVSARLEGFTEQERWMRIPISKHDLICGLTSHPPSGRLYALSGQPPALYDADVISKRLRIFRLADFSSVYGNMKPILAPYLLAQGQIILHNTKNNGVHMMDVERGDLYRIENASILEGGNSRWAGWGLPFRSDSGLPSGGYSMKPCPQGGSFYIFQKGGGSLELLDFTQNTSTSVSLPMTLEKVFPLGDKGCLLLGPDGSKMLLTWEGDTVRLNYIDEIGVSDDIHFFHESPIGSFFCSNSAVIGFVEGFPPPKISGSLDCPVRIVDRKESSSDYVYLYDPEEMKLFEASSKDLSVIHWKDAEKRVIARHRIPLLIQESEEEPQVPPFIALVNDGRVAAADASGNVHLYQVGTSQIQKSLKVWKDLVGHPEKGKLRWEMKRPSRAEVSGPKHGKVDPQNAPHVGGNTWAGGTGGRDTAGLGGKGGPYRLDSGHTVYQVPDEEKAAVPLEIQAAARELARETFRDRLREIRMSPLDINEYERYRKAVEGPVKRLKMIVDSLKAKEKEREWIRLQSHGDLDDTRLVEGLTGEKSIFKRRKEKEPEVGTPQKKPKHLRLVIDVSGSMYRFNGYDGRLEREKEAVLMTMEALKGYIGKIRYEIVGHSGEEVHVPFVLADTPPINPKQQLQVLQMMEAHSQFCWAGDNTLAALRRGMEEVGKVEADERFLILLSDANLERYGISVRHMRDALTKQDNASASVIFIGSTGSQAHRWKEGLPPGKAFVCFDTSELPRILQTIFSSSILR